MKSSSKRLVVQHLENVRFGVLEKHPEIISEYIKGKNGIYALYKKDKLYYVGLATDLMTRLKYHIKGKHAKKWTHFSLFLTKGEKHLKELETLILHVARTRGNIIKGRFGQSVNIKKAVIRKFHLKQKEESDKLFGETKKQVKVVSSKRKKDDKEKSVGPSLAPFIEKGFRIRANFKGKRYIAKVLKSGKINYNGKLYNSPSWAARAIVGRNQNGFSFWKYRSKNGEWVKLDELRKNS